MVSYTETGAEVLTFDFYWMSVAVFLDDLEVHLTMVNLKFKMKQYKLNFVNIFKIL